MRADLVADQSQPGQLVTVDQLVPLFDEHATPEAIAEAKALVAKYGTPIMRAILNELSSVRRQLTAVEAENRRLRSKMRDAWEENHAD